MSRTRVTFPSRWPTARCALAAFTCLPLGSLLPDGAARAQPQAPPAEQVQPAPQADPAFAAADAAYKALERRDFAAALRDAREAVRLAPQRRDYRLLLINALTAAGHPREAEDNITRLLAENPDPELSAQRGYLRSRRGNAAGAAADFAVAAAAFAPGTEKGRALRLAHFDAAIASGAVQQALRAIAPYARERSYAVASRRGFALLALKRYEDARAAFAMAATLATTAADRSAMTRAHIGVLVDLDRMAEARALFARSLAAGTLTGGANLDIAYLALRVGDDPTALAFFRHAYARGQLKGPAAFDAGYVAKRLAQNAEAITYFSMGIDANAAAVRSREPQFIDGVRREVAELERVWGGNFSASYGGVGYMPAGPGATPPSGGSVAQIGGEVYWRPPVIGNRNGALVEAFARAFETVYDQTGGVTGAPTVQGTVGARWKPFPAVNLVLEAGRMIKLGNQSRNDWLLRVAFSHGGGTDLRVDRPHWFTWQVYAEYDRFTETAQNVALFEGRIGESFRLNAISNRLVLFPHVAMIARYDDSLAEPRTYGAGPGLTLRQWFREDTYAAPRSYIEAVFQYRFRIAGDDRVKGVFAGINLLY